jgi:hypothetical protein
LVSVTVWLLLVLPTAWLPKLNVVGLTESCKFCGAPVPLSAIGVGDVGALVESERLPVTLPAVEGVKLTVMAPALPAGTVMGKAKFTVPKPRPITFAAVMVSAAFPAFETVTDCFPLLPTVTVPKARLLGKTEICGCS